MAFDAIGDPDLIEVMAPLAEWDAPQWMVMHVDPHRTLKVQSFIGYRKVAAQSWHQN